MKLSKELDLEIEQKHEVAQTVQRTLVAWAGTLAGLSLQDALQVLVLLATLIYTVINIYLAIRDKVIRRTSANAAKDN